MTDENIDARLNEIRDKLARHNPTTSKDLENDYITLLKLKLDLFSLELDIYKGRVAAMKKKIKDLSEDVVSYRCIICLTNFKCCILEPCCHFVCCGECIDKLPNSLCPICRTRCDFYLKIYNP